MAHPSFRFSSLADVPHLITTRHGGVSAGPYATLNVGYGTDDAEDAVATNRAIAAAAVSGAHGRLSAGRLSHGTDVAIYRQGGLDFPEQKLPVRPGAVRLETFFDADGVVSDIPSQYFLLTFADCVPLLFYDPVRHVLGAAHAGWRGTAAGMAGEMIDALTREFGSEPEDIRVGVGPSIGPCCYEVGPDVARSFQDHGYRAVHTGNRLDLWASTVDQLEAKGVRSIEVSGLCTACNRDTFYSHRGEGGVTGRFALLAGLRS